MQSELSVEEIASHFNISPLTIRRDLDALVQQNAIVRTYGGCILRNVLATTYQKRVAHNFHLKRAIGIAAAEQVRSGDVILIDDGSTTFHIAANLERCAPLTVVTNSIAVIPELSRFEGVQIEILGGTYNRDNNFLGGNLAERLLEMLFFDAVFVGVDSVDREGICSVRSPDVARLTQVMLRRSTRRILLADHTKAGKRGYVSYGSLKDFDLWITTSGLSPELRSIYEKFTTIKEVKSPASDDSGQ